MRHGRLTTDLLQCKHMCITIMQTLQSDKTFTGHLFLMRHKRICRICYLLDYYVAHWQLHTVLHTVLIRHLQNIFTFIVWHDHLLDKLGWCSRHKLQASTVGVLLGILHWCYSAISQNTNSQYCITKCWTLSCTCNVKAVIHTTVFANIKKHKAIECSSTHTIYFCHKQTNFSAISLKKKVNKLQKLKKLLHHSQRAVFLELCTTSCRLMSFIVRQNCYNQN